MNKIILKKPDISSLSRKGYICFDMHIHSEYSSDSNSKITSIIKRAEELGIGIAITDHNDIRGCLEAYKKKKNIIVPAIEVRPREGIDIIFYFSKIKELIDFYKKIVEPNKKSNKLRTSKLSAIDLIEKSRIYKRLVCIAHPYRPYPKKIINTIVKNSNIKSIFNKIKTFEVINSKNFRIFNNKAIKIAQQKNKSIIGGSDSHNKRTIGSTITCVKKNKKKIYIISHVLDEIASNNVLVIGKEINLIFDFIESGIVMIKKSCKS